MTATVHLCVMSDDFGMHPAINEGVAKAFSDGLLTDANLMAPCPAFREAAALARDLKLPSGFHATLTCDWDRYRWGPLTHAPSLTTPEGFFKHRVSLAWRTAREDEVRAELTAQIERVEAEGIHPTHSSYHMGTDGKGRLFRILDQIGTERVGPMRVAQPDEGVPIRRYCWDSQFFSSHWTLNYPRRKARLKGLLRKMQPGYHLWMVHAAVDHPSLDELCSRDHPAWNWARPFRAADMALLMDPEIKALIDELGIQRIDVTRAPIR